jgi:hypothetical protein
MAMHILAKVLHFMASLLCFRLAYLAHGGSVGADVS